MQPELRVPSSEAEPVSGSLPPFLSVSQVKTWLACARKYRLKYVDKRPPESKSDSLALGSAVHSALAWWQQERIDGFRPALDLVLRIFRADWTAQVTDPLLDLDGRSQQDLRGLGEALVRLFVERFGSEPPPAAVEARFEVPLRDPGTGGELAVPLVGYLDALSDGLAWEIKTASRKASASDHRLQLAAYSHAVREMTGRRPRLRVVQLIKTRGPRIEVEEVSVSGRDEAWFMEVATEVFDAIARGAFPPNPSWMCPRCEYRRACRENLVTRRAA